MDKLSKLLTIISMLVSIVLAFQSFNLNKQTFKMNRQIQNDKIKSQANKVALWKISEPEKCKEKGNNLRKNGKFPVYFSIKNSSDLPIYDVVVLDVSSKQDVNLNNITKLYDLGRFRADSEEQHFTYSKNVPPGTEDGFLNGRGNGMGQTDDFVYFFRDAQGITWLRSNNGELEKVSSQNVMYDILNKIGINRADLSVFDNFGNDDF